MMIRSCYIENFGKLHQRTILLDEGLNVFSCENGWGKSTLCAFIKAMFFGLEYSPKKKTAQNERKKYKPWQQGAFGGSISFTAHGTNYRLERFFGERDRDDRFALYNEDTGMPSGDYSQRIGEELFLLDRDSFENTLFFQQGRVHVTASEPISARIAGQSMPVDDIDRLDDACRRLSDEIRIYKKTGKRGLLFEWEEKRIALQKKKEEQRELKEKSVKLRLRSAQLQSAEESLTEKISQADEKLKTLQKVLAEGDDAYKLSLLRNRLNAIDKELLPLDDFFCGGLPEESAVEELLTMADPDTEDKAALKELRRKKSKWTARLESLQEDKEPEEPVGRESHPFYTILLILGLVMTGAGVWKWPQLAISGIVITALTLILLLKTVTRERSENYLRSRGREEREDTAAYERRVLMKKITAADQKINRILEQDEERLEGFLARLGEFQELYHPAKPIENLSDLILVRDRLSAYHRLSREQEELKEREDALKRSMAEKGVTAGGLPADSPEELSERIRHLIRKREELLIEKTTLSRNLEHLDRQIEALGFPENELAVLTEEIGRGKAKIELLEKTIAFLEEAKERYTGRYLSGMNRTFTYYLHLMEPELAERISLNGQLSPYEVGGGEIREEAYMSTGVRDLAGICTRLALVDVMYPEDKPILVMDDPFINLDAGKRGRAMLLLEELARSCQILYMTCSDE